MGRVKGSNTKPEILVRKLLHRMGYRFRLHRKELPGKPDIVLPKHKKLIFVHGCFWHQHSGCRRAARPTSNQLFWEKKLDYNLERDVTVLQELDRLGWSVMIVWECETKNQLWLEKSLADFLKAE